MSAKLYHPLRLKWVHFLTDKLYSEKQIKKLRGGQRVQRNHAETNFLETLILHKILTDAERTYREQCCKCRNVRRREHTRTRAPHLSIKLLVPRSPGFEELLTVKHSVLVIQVVLHLPDKEKDGLSVEIRVNM